MKIGVAVSGLALIMLGGILVALFFFTSVIQYYLSTLQLFIIAGSLIFLGIVLLLVGMIMGRGYEASTVLGSMGATGAVCPKCGRGILAVRGRIRCPYCGKKVIPITLTGTTPSYGQGQLQPQPFFPQKTAQFCRFCGAPLHPVSNFCQQCGRDLRA